jgi:hypothetical protein
MMAVQLRVRDTEERRTSSRRVVAQASTMRAIHPSPIDVTVQDVSRDGCQLSCEADLPLGTPLSIGLAGGGMTRGHIVRRTGQQYGCVFDTVLTPEQLRDAFGAQQVIMPFPAAPWAVPLPEPAMDRWPGAVRAAVLLGGAGLCWAAVATLATALLG